MEPAQPSGPWSLRIVNAVGGILGNRYPALDRESLEAAAREETGLSDFGPEDYRDGLDALCRSANAGDLTTTGRFVVKDAAVRALSNRLLWVRSRAVQMPKPVAPVIVVGIPRSGTTFLHRLLCVDPAALPVPAWQAQRPIPPVQGTDRRVEQSRDLQTWLRTASPSLDRRRVIDPNDADEDMTLFDASLWSLSFPWQLPLWGYLDAYLMADHAPAYGLYAEILGHLELPGRRLTLKGPVHTLHLEDLWAAIPDARLVQTQRDPATVAGSLCTLWQQLHGLGARRQDLHRLGQAVVNLLSTMVERARRARATWPDRVVVDVTYRELLEAPVETVLGLYEHLSLPIPDGLEARLRAEAAEHARGRQPRQDYNLAEFGLTADAVRDRVR